MRDELAGDVEALIASSRTNEHLRALLIEGVRGTSLAPRLSPTLEAIGRDPGRFYSERDSAIQAIEGDRDLGWRLMLIEFLRALGDESSTRLGARML